MAKVTSHEGTVNVCVHTVTYRYWDSPIAITDEVRGQLEEGAEARAQECIAQGYHSGELNCLIDGEHEVRGWWEIAKDSASPHGETTPPSRPATSEEVDAYFNARAPKSRGGVLVAHLDKKRFPGHLRTVCVVYYAEDTVESVACFNDDSAGNKAAEALFWKTAQRLGAKAKDKQAHLDDGVFTTSAGQVFLVHST